MQSNLSFTPKHWMQTDEGDWTAAPTFLGLSDYFEQERLDEMHRIVEEGGTIITVDAKADVSMGEAAQTGHKIWTSIPPDLSRMALCRDSDTRHPLTMGSTGDAVGRFGVEKQPRPKCSDLFVALLLRQ